VSTYAEFLARKLQYGEGSGFPADWLPDWLFDFQRDLVEWAVQMGRGALFADCGLGKAQPADEPVLTPAGWRPIGSLAVGDAVSTVDGTSARVVGVYPQGIRPVVTVTFNDGAEVRCDEDHLWTVATDLDISRDRPWRTLTVRQLQQRGLTLSPREGPRWRVPVARAIHHPSVALPIDPYVMGVLLGDGSFRPPTGPEFCSADPEISAEVKARLPLDLRLSADPLRNRTPSYRIVQEVHPGRGRSNRYLDAVRSWGLHGRLAHEKFIPREYLTASISQRLDLLRGLMDTDGYVANDGTVQFGSSSEALAAGVCALVRSLGGIARRTAKMPTYVYRG
jgi:ATP-dependent DNA helicase RecG